MRLPRSVKEAAAAWYAQVVSDRILSEIQPGFQRWLTADPVHAAAWDALKSAIAWTYGGRDRLPCALRDRLEAVDLKRHVPPH